MNITVTRDFVPSPASTYGADDKLLWVDVDLIGSLSDAQTLRTKICLHILGESNIVLHLGNDAFALNDLAYHALNQNDQGGTICI